MHLQWHEIRARAAKFSEDWKAATRESADKHTFWNEFFECFGVSRKTVGVYEKRVQNFDRSRQGFIDLFIPGSLIVEQKSGGLDLRGASKQAFDYYDWLPEAERPRHILTCDFQRWHLTDLETGQEWRFTLPELKKHVEAFAFIVGTPRRQFRNQKPANPKASELLGKLHEKLAEQGYDGHRLQLLLVRLLFILFADDTGIWPKDQFLVLLEQRTSADGRDLGRWLTELFEVLDTPEDRRQAGLDGDLARVPAHQRQIVRGADRHRGVRQRAARHPARRQRLQLGLGQPRDLRQPVRKRDRQGHPPPAGRALHARGSDPQGDRAAVPRRSLGRVRQAQGQQNWRPAQRADGVPREAGRTDLLRSRLRRGQLPGGRLSRIARARGGAAQGAVPARRAARARGRGAIQAERQSILRDRDRRVPQRDRAGGAVDDRSHRQHQPRRHLRQAVRAHPADHRPQHPSWRRAGAELERRAPGGALQLHLRQPAVRRGEDAVRGPARASAADREAGRQWRDAGLCRGVVPQGGGLREFLPELARGGGPCEAWWRGRRRSRRWRAGPLHHHAGAWRSPSPRQARGGFGFAPHRLRRDQLDLPGRAGRAVVAEAVQRAPAGDRLRPPHLRLAGAGGGALRDRRPRPARGRAGREAPVQLPRRRQG